MMLAFHLLDPSTGNDSLEMLATLIARSAGVTHKVFLMGHRGVGHRAVAAGVPPELIGHIPSMGWADPTGWRGLRKCIRRHDPTHVHAWGVRGVVALAVQSAYAGARIATFTLAPTDRQMKLFRAAEARTPFAWVGSSSSVVRSLLSRGLQHVVRIRPGIAIGAASASAAPLEIRKQLGIAPDHGPVVLIGGEPQRASGQAQALWATGILQQLYPKTRAILRLRDDAESDHIRAFAHTLPPGCDPAGTAVEAPPDTPWPTLAKAADMLLVTPDGPASVGSILWAMAAGTPVIGTATSEVGELVEHGRSGLLARPGKVKSIAARLEEFMNDSRLRWPLTDTARADVYAHFKPAFLAECFRAVYQHTMSDPRLASPIELPTPPVTAADRFSGVVQTT